MTKALSSIVIFAVLVLGQSIARTERTAAYPAAFAHIESPRLRIDFDKNMRSRVIARFDGKDVPLGAFSASETVKGDKRSWYNFTLTSQARERVTDTYGAGEKLTLVGISGVLRKNLAVVVY